MEEIKKLTKRLMEEFGDRKQEGRLSIITDLNNQGKIYPIPHDQEHIEFCTNLLGDIRKLKKVIPSHIEYDKIEGEYEITSILTGESGMEQGYGIRHEKLDITTAHQKILEFIQEGEILISRKLNSKINYDYSS